jgi:tetratricopeptide (TPR) repeat protein
MAKRQVNFLRRAVAFLCFGGCILLMGNIGAGETPEPEVFRDRALSAYEKAVREHESHTADVSAACRLGRAIFDWAEFATNSTQRTELAERGIAICRKAVSAAPTNAAAHLYLGMNQGQLAKSRPFSALRLVREMESHFQSARVLDEQFELAAPDRLLGLLYQQTPGWPASIGNKFKARRHLARAVELAPDYPDNRLALAEALAEWKDWKSLAKEASAIIELWPRAKHRWQGVAWEESWVGWEQRWKELRAILAKHSSPQ